MFDLGDIVIGYFVFLFGWYLWQAQKSREYAREVAARYCKELGLQFLDDTVVLNRIRLKKNSVGRVKVSRVYRFEFSSLGDERYQGVLELLGNELESIELEAHRV